MPNLQKKYETHRTNIPAGHPKESKWRSQAQRVYEALLHRPMTRLQVSAATETPLQNTCRYVAELRKSGLICVVRKGVDPLSKMPAEYLSVDPGICRPCAQFKLFV